MATREITVHVVDCNICGQPYERDDMARIPSVAI